MKRKLVSVFAALTLVFACAFVFAACETVNPLDYAAFGDAEYIYDGTEKSITVTGLAGGASVAYEPTNKYTEVGEYTVTATLSLEKYPDVVLTAKLTIKPAYKTESEADEKLAALQNGIDDIAREIAELSAEYEAKIAELEEELADPLEYYPLPDGTYSVAAGRTKYLETLIIPEKHNGKTVSEIAKSGFSDAQNLKSITIPDSVTSIGESAFSGCSSLTSVYYNGTEYEWQEISIYSGNDCLTNATIYYYYTKGLAYKLNSYSESYSVTGIGTATDTDIVIPSKYNGNPVTSIGFDAFSGCSSLTSVTIGDGVTSIGERAFEDCYSLTSVTIPDNVTIIGSYAFSGCRSLTSITIPDSVMIIGIFAFSGCRSLTSVYYEGDIADWCNIIFGYNYSNPLYYAHNLYIKENGEYKLVTDLVIPDGVTSIDSAAFSGCSSLTSVTIGNSVTYIGRSAFEDCYSLTSVTIPESVTSIGERAFYNCSSLTSVTIPDSVTSMGNYAFSGCSSLTSVYYKGPEYKWQAINIYSKNESLTNATIYYSDEPVAE